MVNVCPALETIGWKRAYRLALPWIVLAAGIPLIAWLLAGWLFGELTLAWASGVLTTLPVMAGLYHRSGKVTIALITLVVGIGAIIAIVAELVVGLIFLNYNLH